MNAKTCIAVALLAGAGLARAQDRGGDGGAYLSFAWGSGRIAGGNAEGHREMRGDAFEARLGHLQGQPFGMVLPSGTATRIDVVHYNEGHPDNHHRDGFALQGVLVQRLAPWLVGELGIGPYLSMDTTNNGVREIDDGRTGALLSAALRVDLPGHIAPPGTHVRVTFNHVVMPGAHRSDALVVGVGRQFGPARADPAPDAPAARLWLGGAFGRSITNMSDTGGAFSGALEARQYGRRWGVGYQLLFEGDDGARVDRRGVAAQLWYLQPVTARFAVGAAVGPYVARNRRDADDGTRVLALVTLQAERALSSRTYGDLRAFVNFSRVKTFQDRNDRDVIQLGILRRF